MPSRRRRSSEPPPGDFGEDDRTVVDGVPVAEDEHVTPVEIPRCVECGAVVFDDDFDDIALVIGLDRCVRSKPNVADPWHWCANYSPTHRKMVRLVPR